MKVLGNIIWVVFGGLIWAIVDFILGALCCVTIIGIPLGIQLFKLGRFVIWPFGRNVTTVNNTVFKTVLNIIWAIFFGWEMFLGYSLTGIIFCITIIGIPFGKKYFHIALFALLPLGRDFR